MFCQEKLQKNKIHYVLKIKWVYVFIDFNLREWRKSNGL